MRMLRFHAVGDVVLGGYVPGAKPHPLSGATVTITLIAAPHGAEGVGTSNPRFDIPMSDAVEACEKSVLVTAVATITRGGRELTSDTVRKEVSVDQLMGGGPLDFGTLVIFDYER